ncbi:MAG: phosphoribosylanthranilate isomerase [Firmicutes bacterium]|nr:phosphoribosylanthranilate isomerase [Bacillota bacterium]
MIDASDQAVKVKLCGLMSSQDVSVARDAGADYIGFVLAPSRRKVAPDDVHHWLHDASSQESTAACTPVLVLVDESLEQVVRYTQQTGVRHVQLCGDETPEQCAQLRNVYGLVVWKAWGVRGTAQDRELIQYSGAVDALLLDRYADHTRGGTGQPFAWEQIDEIHALVPQMPLIIAGGLTAERVTSLLSHNHPFAVDVSSGIETAGSKDPQKMSAFVQTVRSVSHVSR